MPSNHKSPNPINERFQQQNIFATKKKYDNGFMIDPPTIIHI